MAFYSSSHNEDAYNLKKMNGGGRDLQSPFLRLNNK